MKKTILFLAALFILASCEKQTPITVAEQAAFSKADYLGTWKYAYGDTLLPITINESGQSNSVHVIFPFHLQEFYYIGVNSKQWESIEFPHQILFGASPPEQGIVLSGDILLNSAKDKLTVDIITVEFNAFDPFFDGDTSHFSHICVR